MEHVQLVAWAVLIVTILKLGALEARMSRIIFYGFAESTTQKFIKLGTQDSSEDTHTLKIICSQLDGVG